MRKVLVTGATGFIGHYVISWLINEKQKQNITIIATATDEKKASKFPWFEKITFLPFDLQQFNQNEDYFQFFRNPDLLIHLAWEGLPNYKESFHLEQNLPRHFAFLKNMIDGGLNDLTITGTCLEYGKKEGELTESMQAEPEIAYAIAKNELRQSLEKLQQQSEFVLKWVRLFYMWGKGQNPNSLLSQLEKALDNNEAVFNMSGGKQERDYLPVEKVAEYIVDIALQKRVSGIINCSSGRPVKIEDFVHQYLDTIGKNIRLNLGFYPYPDYEAMSFWGDTKKLKTIIGND